jgi:hypothetical protein
MSDQTQPDARGPVPPSPPQPGSPPPPGAPSAGSPPPPGAPPPGYQYQPSGYAQHYSGYAPPTRTPLDLPKLVFIAAWVVLGLFGLWFIYTLTQDDLGADFGDRLFGSLQGLATGIFYAAVLLAVSVWLGKQKTTD